MMGEGGNELLENQLEHVEESSLLPALSYDHLQLTFTFCYASDIKMTFVTIANVS